MTLKYNILFIIVFAFVSCGRDEQKPSDSVPAAETVATITNGKPMDDVSDKVNMTADTVPVLPNEANTLEEFIPEDYTLVVMKEGDLNADNLPDGVIVIEPKNEENGSPRILLICFKAKNGNYTLKETSIKAYAPKYDSFGQEISKFDILDIKDGEIFIGQYKYGYQWNSDFKYKYENGVFNLIYYSNYSAGAGGSSQLSYDLKSKILKRENTNTETLKTTSEPETIYTFTTIPTIKNINENTFTFK